MKGLTVKQPWATLIAKGLKNWVISPGPTGYRGDLVICSAATFDQPDEELVKGNGPIAKALWQMRPADVPRGVSMCVATLEDCVLMSCGFVWIFSNVRPTLAYPLPLPGGDGLWDIPQDYEMFVERALVGA
jgi:hypothetical protein